MPFKRFLSYAGRALALGLVVAAVSAAPFGSATAAGGDLLVFAAASQKDALNAAIAAYNGKTAIKASYASSSTLARQIEHGAPADVFISANVAWMDYLQKRKLIAVDTRRDFFGNGLVLIAPKGSSIGNVTIGKGLDLVGLLGKGRLAIGDPDHVPAGIYGKAALKSLGIWNTTEPRLARAENVRAALALVSRGETPLGIVYASDAVADHGVKVVGRFPEGSHPPIVYPAAVLARSKRPEAAKAFLAYLRTPAAAKIFGRFGFLVLD
jgi:molybdate transport system substrate-binding protein